MKINLEHLPKAMNIYGKEDVFINGADGLYFIVLKTNREKKTFKIIKQ